MGWWADDATKDAPQGTNGMVWGDECADILDATLDKIRAVYQRDWGRDPTKDELRAGLEFSLGGM